jgi:alkaline phosphatase D
MKPDRLSAPARPPYSFVAASEGFNRRSFIVTTSLAAAALWSTRPLAAVTPAPKFAAYPFQLGIASGDPSPDGFVLWTRLAPKPLEGGGMPQEPVAVSWEIAEDEKMAKIIAKGDTIATPEWAHSVHIEVAGLKPDRWYWYRFIAGGEASPIGRARTMPAVDAMPDRLCFTFASCQNYSHGYYTAYEHMAAEDPDFVIHLGDYIYEGAEEPIGPKRPRQHLGKKIKTLEQYRNRFALYKSDPLLQEMHARAPWIVTWDDHEVYNDYAGAVQTGEALQRRAAAYKAYYEHMPLRRASLPHGPEMQVYRRLAFGRLADFSVLDTRQFRTVIPQDGKHLPQDKVALDPQGTILGTRQREWLFAGLTASSARWNVLAQQVLMGRVDLVNGPETGFPMNTWPGYEADRRRLLDFMMEKKISNPVVLTGDIHTNWANELISDFSKPDAPSAAIEFVGTSITSKGDTATDPIKRDAYYSENPFVKYYSDRRGYVRCEITPDLWRTDYRAVGYVSRPGAPVDTDASFVIESGRSVLKKA